MIPWIVIKPALVANLFNLGAGTIMASFGFLWGPMELLKRFMQGAKKMYALGFLVSFVLCLYMSLIKQSFFMTLIVLCFEVSFLMYFICSFFPGGQQGLNTLLKTGRAMVSKCFKMVF